MNLRSRLERLERGGKRAQKARRRLPHCTDPVEAFGLLVNHPPRICHELLLLTPTEILTTLYEVTMQVYGEQV